MDNFGKTRALITPEGLDLHITLADAGARIGAFVIDILIMILTLLAFTWALFALNVTMAGDIATILWILVFFFLRNFYFIFFEMGPKAATPGKRIMKIRVAPRRGLRLTANAVFVRNALREIEFFLPLSFLGANTGSVDGWISLFGLMWAGIFLCFPLFNKDRLRAGDLVGGTWVVRAPRMMLAQDISEQAPDSEWAISFTPEQIAVYGIKELHILEDVIRGADEKILSDVSQRIRKKIQWEPQSSVTDLTFLKAYYKALRSGLESRMLMGVKRKDKYDKQR